MSGDPPSESCSIPESSSSSSSSSSSLESSALSLSRSWAPGPFSCPPSIPRKASFARLSIASCLSRPCCLCSSTGVFRPRYSTWHCLRRQLLCTVTAAASMAADTRAASTCSSSARPRSPHSFSCRPVSSCSRAFRSARSSWFSASWVSWERVVSAATERR